MIAVYNHHKLQARISEVTEGRIYVDYVID